MSRTEFSSTGATRISGSHSRLTQVVRPRLKGKQRTLLSSRVATCISWRLLSGLKGVRPPVEFGERTRDCSLGHAAAAKSLQSCPTLFNPTDSSPPGVSYVLYLQLCKLDPKVCITRWIFETHPLPPYNLSILGSLTLLLINTTAIRHLSSF